MADQRHELAEILAAHGIDAATMPEELSEVTAFASDSVLGRSDSHSARDLADRSGQSLTQLTGNLAHLGIVVDDPDSVMFNDDDLQMVRFLELATTELLTEEEGVEVLHVAATALSTLTEASVASHVQGPELRSSDLAAATRLNIAITELGLELSRLLPAAFRHHLRQSAHANRRMQNFEIRELVTACVGFVDMVGFTSLSHDLDASALVTMIKQFESRAHELAHRHRTRIVKLIGDEVMFVAESPEQGAAFAVDMIAQTGDIADQARGGLAYGELINVHGDLFGPVVNTAARLVDIAVPGEVLITEAVAAHCPSEPAGRRMLKGFDQPVIVCSLTP